LGPNRLLTVTEKNNILILFSDYFTTQQHNNHLHISPLHLILTMAPTVLHLRSETKPLEHRSALTPTTTATLIKVGYVINVERSPLRIFDDAEFEAAGATLVPEHSWVDAPKEHIIIGLKELEEKECK
jgi:hypothetical protein